MTKPAPRKFTWPEVLALAYIMAIIVGFIVILMRDIPYNETITYDCGLNSVGVKRTR